MPGPSFKECIAVDMGTFINPSEFADKHIIDGKSVIAVVEDDTEGKHPLAYAEGVSLYQTMVYIEEHILPRRPPEGSQMELDGEWYTVMKVSVEDGLMILALEANQA